MNLTSSLLSRVLQGGTCTREELLALRREPLSFDELIARTQFSAAKLNSLLTMLELKGIIDQSAGRTYATKS